MNDFSARPQRIPFPCVDFHPPVYGIRRTRQTANIDGDIHKPFWDQAPYTDLFSDIEGEQKETPRFATRAKMLWDDQALYIAAELEGDEIWAHVRERDAVIFADNDFEVFIDPDSDTHQYYELEMNALNTVWDLLLTKPYRDGGAPVDSWDIKGLRTAVKIRGDLNRPGDHNKGWSVELALPFRTLMETTRRQGAPRAGEYWRINFSRVQWKTDVRGGRYEKRRGQDGKPLPEDNWVWSPTGVVNIHYPELWGYAFFLGEEGGTCEIPQEERLKWNLRRVYYAQHAHFDRFGRFEESLQRLAAEFEMTGLDGVTMECTTHGFEAFCTSESGKTVVLGSDGRAYTL